MQDILFSVDHEDRSLAILSFFQPWTSQREVWSHAHAFIPPQRSASQHRPLTPHTTLSLQGALLAGISSPGLGQLANKSAPAKRGIADGYSTVAVATEKIWFLPLPQTSSCLATYPDKRRIPKTLM
jgi:hypothetical protein